MQHPNSATATDDCDDRNYEIGMFGFPLVNFCECINSPDTSIGSNSVTLANSENRRGIGLDFHVVNISDFNYPLGLDARCNGLYEWFTLTYLLATRELEGVFEVTPHTASER